jgi:hypothetical protein
VIESDLGVKSRHTIWGEHLYELAGFQELLGENLAARLKGKDPTVQPGDLAVLRRICVRLKGQPVYDGLENLTVTVAAVAEGRVQLTAVSDNNVIQIALGLDFSAERIVFNFENDLKTNDDGSELSVRRIATVFRFLDQYIGNGKLLIYSADDSTLLGRKDAYIPMNIIPSLAHDYYSELISQCEVEAEARALRAREAGV